MGKQKKVIKVSRFYWPFLIIGLKVRKKGEVNGYNTIFNESVVNILLYGIDDIH